MLEFYAAAVFSAVWLIPALLALRWERRLRLARAEGESGSE
jgi:hypothetical protein